MKKSLAAKRKLEKLFSVSRTLAPPEHFDYYSSGIGFGDLFVPDKIHVWHLRGIPPENAVRQHCRYVLKIVLEGENISVLNKHSLKLRAGQAILIFPYQNHSNMPADTGGAVPEFLLVNFLPASVCPAALETLKNRIIDLSDKDVELLLDLVDSVKGTEKVNEQDTGSILAWLLHRFQLRLQKAAPMPSGAASLPRRIDDFIRSNFNRKLTLRTICEHFKISRTTLQRIFAAEAEQRSPGAQIRFLKLQQSLEWIMHSENSIKEIALFCGYADQFTYSRAFKKKFLISPSALRKMKKNNP